MKTQPSRRRFLKTGLIAAAAVGVTACGGLALAASDQPGIDLPTSTFGEYNMNNRILIAYASKAGSTAEVAVRLGEDLGKQNASVDVLPISKVADLSPYQAVILGSAIRVGKILPEAMAFIEKNQTALQQKPFHLFILCMTLEKDTEEDRKTVSAYLDPVRALVKPASEGLFAGAMNLAKLPFIERVMITLMKAPTGDFRRWDQIQAWGQNLPLN